MVGVGIGVAIAVGTAVDPDSDTDTNPEGGGNDALTAFSNLHWYCGAVFVKRCR